MNQLQNKGTCEDVLNELTQRREIKTKSIVYRYKILLNFNL